MAEGASGITHVVASGDTLDSIAERYGHFWETIWHHPDNAGLKAQRPHRNMLVPDDRVFVPPLREKLEERPTTQHHRFRRRGVPTTIRFVVRARDGTPFGNKAYTLEVGARRYEGTTAADGTLFAWIAPAARHGRLDVRLDTVGYPEWLSWKLDVGGLEPVSTVRGVQARLNNLHYEAGSENGELGAETRAALRRFQARHDLRQTGDIDDATRAKLRQVAGG
jgi:hypothetical protein